jgi:hypothetical protein
MPKTFNKCQNKQALIDFINENKDLINSAKLPHIVARELIYEKLGVGVSIPIILKLLSGNYAIINNKLMCIR